MKVYLDKPPTDLDFLILITMRANPNVCTVPERVKINENYPSLNMKQRTRMITERTTQYAASYFLNRPILILILTIQQMLYNLNQIRYVINKFCYKYQNFRMEKYIFLLFLTFAISTNPSLPQHTLPIYGNASLGYYFVKIYVGHPPQQQSVIIDTGSGQLALPCNKCQKCNPNHINPPFNMKKSKTAQYVTCESKQAQCRQCSNKNPTQSCRFTISYAEGSSLNGIIIKDSIQFQSFSEGQQIVTTFGCTTTETNLFLKQQANGIFGLCPQRTSSLLQEMYKMHHGYSGQELQFSLCLTGNGGIMTIGKVNQNLHLSTESIKTTFSSHRNLYSLNGIGEIKIKNSIIHNPQQNFGIYGIFIDSGSTFTYFPRQNYFIFRKELIDQCNSKKQSCEIAQGQSTLCFHLKGQNDLLQQVSNIFSPIQILISGKKSIWTPQKYFLLRDKSNREVCLGIESLDRYLLGANWMVDKDVVFNLKQKTIQIFQKSDCSGKSNARRYMSPYSDKEDGNEPLKYSQATGIVKSWQIKLILGVMLTVIGLGGILVYALRNNKRNGLGRVISQQNLRRVPIQDQQTNH